MATIAIRRRLTAVRRSLRALDRALADFAAAMPTYRPASAGAAKVGRRRPMLSPTRRAALKFQGRYMGYMRHLKPMQKALVRSVLEKNSKKAAIKKAQMLTGKRKAA